MLPFNLPIIFRWRIKKSLAIDEFFCHRQNIESIFSHKDQNVQHHLKLFFVALNNADAKKVAHEKLKKNN